MLRIHPQVATRQETTAHEGTNVKTFVSRKNRGKALLTVKMDPDVYADFATAAELRGLRPSSLVHQFAITIIREEQMRNAAVFTLKRATVKDRIARNSAAKKKLNKGRIAKVRIIEIEEPDEAA